MASQPRNPLHAILRAIESGTWRRLLTSLATWGRHQLARLIVAALLIWLLLFSGLEDAPKTEAGRLVAMLLAIIGVAMVGLFTATVASLLVEKYLRRREVNEFQMEDHLILC